MTSKPSFVPTLLLPEVYYPYYHLPGFAAKKVEQVAEEGFYGGVEVGGIEEYTDRKRIRDAAVKGGLNVTYWMTSVITDKNLDISAIDAETRRHAVEEINKRIALAAECGASQIALITGPDPGEFLREAAACSLYESLISICEASSDFNIDVLIEPLDREVHKKRFIGPTNELIEIISDVKESKGNIGFAFDTAHAALNGENLQEALKAARPYISQLHFSNGVLDKSDPLFGDYHIPLGRPGFLDFKTAVSLLEKADSLGILSNNPLRISVEVRSLEETDPEITEKEGKAFLQQLSRELETER